MVEVGHVLTAVGLACGLAGVRIQSRAERERERERQENFWWESKELVNDQKYGIRHSVNYAASVLG